MKTSTLEQEKQKSDSRSPGESATRPQASHLIRLLLVDDEPDFLELMHFILKRDGYSVASACSALEALQHLREHPVDILVTDIRLPGIDGLELARSARTDYPWMQVIALSAHGKTSDVIDLVQDGTIHFISKPVSNDELRLAVGSACEKIRLQSQLHQTSAQLERVIASIPSAIWSAELQADLSLAFTFVSPVIASLTGRDAYFYQRSPRPFQQIIHTGDWPLHEAALRHLLARPGRRQDCEYRIIHTDGSIRFMHNAITCEIRPDGEIMLNGILSDITHQKHIETQLLHSESFQKAIIEALPDMIFVFDARGCIETCHASDASMLYASPDLFLGKTLWEVLPGPLAGRLDRARMDVLQSRRMLCMEYQLPINGDNRYFESRFSFMQPDHVLGVVRDITEQKQTALALSESEELYRAIVRNSHDPIFIYDGQRIVFANEHMATLLGYSRAELQNRDIRSLIHPEDLEEACDLAYDYTQRAFSANYMTRFIHKQRGVIPCQLSVSLTTHNKNCAVLGILRAL